MLADAVGPHGGIVIWRAFVYSNDVPTDRVKQAYDEFTPLDGQFRDNVLIQVKNGPLDFQPREPFSPLFGAMPKTPLILEFQITKEYLGEDTHLVYLGSLMSEVLSADTWVHGKGSTVASVIDGSLHGYRRTGIAGVANTGTDRNWTGSHFNQANWYAFGRLAWDPRLSPAAIAEEWTRRTFSNDPKVVAPIVHMMLVSREAVVNYMTPLGLAHMMGTDHHYGPAPWARLARADWMPSYYHRADSIGVGFERSPQGSDAVSQYAQPLRDLFGDRAQTPDSLLLWFHHVGLDGAHEIGTHVVGGSLLPLPRGNRHRQLDASHVAVAPGKDRQRSFSRRRRFPRDPGARGRVVARRRALVLPNVLESASAEWLRAVRASALVLPRASLPGRSPRRFSRIHGA